MATTNLGRVRPVPKGAWSSGTAYKILDIVSYGGGSYICLADVTSSTTPNSDSAHWLNLAQKGDTGAKGDTGQPGQDGAPGTPGKDGAQGQPGTAAGFGTPTASVDGNVGTPSVTVTASGDNTAKVFNFAFKNLKGQKGDTGSPGTTDYNALQNKPTFKTINGETITGSGDISTAKNIWSGSSANEVTNSEIVENKIYLIKFKVGNGNGTGVFYASNTAQYVVTSYNAGSTLYLYSIKFTYSTLSPNKITADGRKYTFSSSGSVTNGSEDVTFQNILRL